MTHQIQNQVRDALGVGDTTVDEIARHTKLDRADIQAALNSLIADGIVECTRHGGYLPLVDANGVPFTRLLRRREATK